ncbi:hypothetical protein BGZ65_005968 [Modicella reniformis]|uniref:LYR motif-containing protein Cup1-like N-terminal domain-containing protein n=1 Tax=Modicella reniformis TaxID=1440133 RepID=A0A9P6IJY9_9FUNG|nr:hypothetical protein BGZ65_005968 [Modicella reniformis]
MPTYAPVPSSFTTLSHRGQALFLYRHILREGSKFFDERTSQWVRSRAQEAFRKNRTQAADNKIQKSLSDARKALRLLERANQMDFKAVMRLLRLTYGILGQERRKLLQPFVDSTRSRTMSSERLSEAISNSGSNASQAAPKEGTSLVSQPVSTTTPQLHISTDHLASTLSQATKSPKPLHYEYQRSVPPILSAPLASLIRSVTGKSVEPTLPEPLFKPLHGKREANLRWRFLTKQMGKVTPPLPSEIRQEVEWKSRVGLHKLGKEDTTNDIIEYPANWDEWEQRILQTIKAWNRRGTGLKERRWESGWIHPTIGGKPARPNTLTPRLYRRMWQHLLDDVPVLDVQLVTPKSESVNEEKATIEDSSPSTPVTPPLKLVFSVSKSAQSYQARSTTSLRQRARVNNFDQIGISEDASLLVVKGRKKGQRDHS